MVGKKLGFADTRGTLFFEIERILRDKQPKYFILENVKGLVSHDKGNTLKTILNSLSADYTIAHKLFNAVEFGIPQNRERLIIIGIHKSMNNSIHLNVPLIPKKEQENLTLRSILEQDVAHHYLSENNYTLISNPKRNKKSGLVFVGYLNKPLRNGINADKLSNSRSHKQ